MEYKVSGTTVPVAEVKLQAGEAMYTQSGGMAWQSEGIEMATNAKGGVLKGFGRMFSGESFFMATYTAKTDAMIAFASTMPGNIIPLNVDENPGMVIQKRAFLCAMEGVELSVEFTKKFASGLFGGEGFILQKLNGRGMAFLEVAGDVFEKELAPGEVLKVDTGNVVAFAPTVQYEVEMVKGLGNIFFGGEGLFLTKLTGPGKVYLQSLNFGEFAGRINALAPSK